MEDSVRKKRVLPDWMVKSAEKNKISHESLFNTLEKVKSSPKKKLKFPASNGEREEVVTGLEEELEEDLWTFSEEPEEDGESKVEIDASEVRGESKEKVISNTGATEVESKDKSVIHILSPRELLLVAQLVAGQEREQN